MVAVLLAGLSSCATVPHEEALLRAAGRGEGCEARVVAYDAKTGQATVDIRGQKSGPMYRWFQFENGTWRALPMTAVRAPAPAAEKENTKRDHKAP